MFEEQMRDTIREFIKNSGYEVYEMVPLLYGKIDFVGINDKDCVVIESKISKWKKALSQILRYGYGADFQYIAMPKKTARFVYKNYLNILSDYEVGLLSVEDNKVEILSSYRNENHSYIYKKKIINMVKYRKNNSKKRIKIFKERFDL